MKTSIIKYIITFAVGFAVAFLFFEPAVVKEIVVKTETRVDTVFRAHEKPIYVPYKVLVEKVDTVYYSKPFKTTVSRYKGSEVLDYGTIDWMAETTGKLVNFSVTPKLQLPTIIKEIETVKTVTTVRDLRGIYAGAGINQEFGYKVGASYVDKDWQFNYDYQPKDKIHWVGVKRRLF